MKTSILTVIAILAANFAHAEEHHSKFSFQAEESKSVKLEAHKVVLSLKDSSKEIMFLTKKDSSDDVAASGNQNGSVNQSAYSTGTTGGWQPESNSQDLTQKAFINTLNSAVELKCSKEMIGMVLEGFSLDEQTQIDLSQTSTAVQDCVKQL